MGRLDESKLRKAGFALEKCEDGIFWVLEKSPGPDSQRLLATCRLCITGCDILPPPMRRIEAGASRSIAVTG